MSSSKYARMYFRPGRGWYGDFRNYRSVGGALEALIAEGSRRATLDQVQAHLIFARRLQVLQDLVDGKRPVVPRPPAPRITEYLDRHFELKQLRKKTLRAAGIERDRDRLTEIADRWGNPRVDAITTAQVNSLIIDLGGQGLAAQTICHRVNALSSLLRSAFSEGHVAGNVVEASSRPAVEHGAAPFLESDAGARLLEAAIALGDDRTFRGPSWIGEIVATALLSGGRKSELSALDVRDIDFNQGVVHYRPNQDYPVRKSRHATRDVPLWPQLRRILVPFVGTRRAGLLFPHPRGGTRTMQLHDSLERVFVAAGVKRPLRKAWHLFRHTYTAMRLQTLDGGEPVSLWTVSRELGHGSTALIEQTYGHLLKVRQRLDRVEYRKAQPAGREAKRA